MAKTFEDSLNLLIPKIVETCLTSGEKENSGTDISTFRISSGYQCLDNYTNFAPSTLTLIAGHVESGKTSLLNSITVNVICHGHKVLFNSLQQNNERLTLQLLSNHSRVEMQTLLNGNLTHDDMDKLFSTMHTIGKSGDKLLLSHHYKIEDIEKNIITMVEQNNITLVCIDGINLIRNDNYTTLYEQQKNITQRLKNLAMSLNVAIIVTSGINVDYKTRSNKRPLYSDILYSTEYDFDTILGLYRDETFNDESEMKGLVTISTLKNKGNFGKINMAFLDIYLRFESLVYKEMLIEPFD